MLKLLRTLALMLWAAGCAGERTYDVQGLVVAVDESAGTLTVSHDPVPGFMTAMVMPFTAGRPGDLRAVRPGDRVRFRLHVGGDRSVIDGIQVLSAGGEASGIETAPSPPKVAHGAEVPDFALTDQHGVRVSLGAQRGRVVVLGAIYTRCPLPDYCPRVMTNMAALRDRFEAWLGDDLTLFTLTFDPTHDTPVKLQAYAASYGANVDGWHLLTGDPGEVARVCALFGIQFYPDEGMIAHSLQMVVIDRNGRLAALVEGRDFSAKQLADVVGEALKR